MLVALAIIPFVTGGPGQIAETSDPRVEAFREYCLPTRLDPALTRSELEGAGWIVVTEAAHPELPALLALDRAQALAVEATVETVIFRKGALFATVNVSTAVIPDAQASSLASVAPVVRLDRPYGRIVQWNLSDSLPGAGNLQTSYFPEGSPAVAQTGFTGAAIFLTSDLDARP